MKQLYEKVPFGRIKAMGWYKKQLSIQAKGVTGIIDRYWKDLGENSGWLGGNGESWERGPYYLDGLLPLAWLLDDEQLKQKAQKWIDWTLSSQRENGNFGPSTNSDSWPRSVMLKCLIQYEDISGDKRVLPFILRYLSFFDGYIRNEKLHVWDWSRGEEFLVIIMWAYKHNPETWLKDLADLVISSSFNWLDYYSCFPYPRPTGFYYDWKSYIDKFSNEIYTSSWYHGTHGVNVAMGLRMALLQAYFSGDPDPKELLLRAISNLLIFHGTANGMFNCSEHLAGNDPTQGVELCTIVEYMYSLETMLPWFDGVQIGDMLETVAYNALPASMTADMSGHQYLQQVNQIMCTEAERPWYNNKSDSNIFGLEPHFGCCTANLHQGWPKFISSCWMRLNDNGVVAAVFTPCAFDFVAANGKKCTIQELTGYPFDEKISFVFSCDDNIDFLFMIRIPSWCNAAEIVLPGGKKMNPAAGQYFEAGRRWRNGDTVEMRLPFTIRTTYWQNNSVSLSYGPLVLALKMDEVWTKIRGEDPFPYWEVRSSSPWNYALVLDKSGTPNFKMINNSIAEQPFSAENPPFVIEAPAKRIPEWKEKNNSAGMLPLSPVAAELCSNEVEMIKLIPYGAARLRITQFPYIEQE